MKIFYTDGSTRIKNQKGVDNVGGWGVVCFSDENENIIYDLESNASINTTNNREELKALIWALNIADDQFPKEECIIYSDSAYVVNMCNDWIWTWASNGWKNSKKQTVENLDLVQEIWKHISKEFYHCKIKKCSGHAGEVGNEIADALARGYNNRVRDLIETWEIKYENPEPSLLLQAFLGMLD